MCEALYYCTNDIISSFGKHNYFWGTWHQVLCCAPGKDIVDIEIRGTGGDVLHHKVVLEEGEGDKVAFLILNGVEQAQRMDRD